MKYIVIVIFILSPSISSFAQEVRFPPQCNARILGPMDEALCGDLFEAASTASDRFTNSLALVKSTKQWDQLQIIKLKFLSNYYSCSITGSGPKVSACLQPALQDAINSLPATTVQPDSDTIAQARKVNLAIENAFYDSFKQCIYKRAAAIDDGVSTANDIAQGIGEWCRPFATKLATVRFETLSTSLITSSPTFYQTQAVADDLLRPSNLIKYVLDYRAKKRTKTHKQNQPR